VNPQETVMGCGESYNLADFRKRLRIVGVLKSREEFWQRGCGWWQVTPHFNLVIAELAWFNADPSMTMRVLDPQHVFGKAVAKFPM
jgi:hypothetical protein